MSRTRIEWVVAVAAAIGGKPEAWNPVVGCEHRSPGCKNCYAERLAGTRLKHTAKYAGLTKQGNAGPRWTGNIRVIEDEIKTPLSWRGRRAVFVCDMGDLFHDDVPLEVLDRIFAVMECRPDCVFMVLTKREVGHHLARVGLKTPSRQIINPANAVRQERRPCTK